MSNLRCKRASMPLKQLGRPLRRAVYGTGLAAAVMLCATVAVADCQPWQLNCNGRAANGGTIDGYGNTWTQDMSGGYSNQKGQSWSQDINNNAVRNDGYSVHPNMGGGYTDSKGENFQQALGGGWVGDHGTSCTQLISGIWQCK